MKRKPNNIVDVKDGVAKVDVSTRKHPNTVTLIDEVDLPFITESPRRWSAHRCNGGLYVVREMGTRKNRKMERLHRLLLGLTDDAVKGDHIRLDTLDNRRSQLRVATNQQNARNTRSRASSTSRFLGVSYKTREARWVAQICNGRTRQIGLFVVEEDAARAYDEAAFREFGVFANLNFPRAIAA